MAGYRVGDPKFAAFFNEMTTDHYRVVNHQDFVPRTQQRFKGYKHTATEFYLEDDTFRQCDDTGEDPTCSYQWEWKPWTYKFSDHLKYFGEDAKLWDWEKNCGGGYEGDYGNAYIAKQQVIDRADGVSKQSLLPFWYLF